MERSAEAAWAAGLIRTARTRVGYDLRWAADVLGVSRGYLLEVEMGLLAPSLSLCRRVVATFPIPADEAAELLAAGGCTPVEGQAPAWLRA